MIWLVWIGKSGGMSHLAKHVIIPAFNLKSKACTISHGTISYGLIS